jgi:hypothetical protein
MRGLNQELGMMTPDICVKLAASFKEGQLKSRETGGRGPEQNPVVWQSIRECAAPSHPSREYFPRIFLDTQIHPLIECHPHFPRLKWGWQFFPPPMVQDF